jgi:hypothetical protein
MCTLVLTVAFGLNGCKKKDVAEETPEEAPATPAPTAATPEPTKPVAVATPPPATPAPELAPPGVFYLITAVSVETSDGILGLKPGQLLKEVRPGVYRADTNEVTLRPDQVTNDMAVARRFAAQDQRNQAAIQQRLAASAPAPSASSATGTPSTESRSSAPPAAQEDPKVKARQELMQQRMAIQQQENALAVTLNQASLRYGNWDAAAKKSPQAYQLLQQFNALRRQGENLDAQISQMR